MLATAEFGGFAQRKLILVDVDFPQKKKQSDALKKANQALADRFKVEGYPTVLLVDAEGKKVAEIDAEAETPRAFISALEKYTGK